MRVLIAPDAFRGTLSGDQAAAAVADGWARGAAGDELTRSPIGEAAATLETAADDALPDLVVTGEGSLEFRSLRDSALAAVSAAAMARGVPCIVLAGQVHVGPRMAFESGIHGAYATAADAGSVEASMADPAGTLTTLAEGIAVHWGGRRGRTDLRPELLPDARPNPTVPGPRDPGGQGAGPGL
ncbi:glycerate kinase [Actinomycetospora endophytica]|uniref:Glycerate kinase n=1 Tax=Actinomycetospora endophytica TaxID=2291215 RepID=A0ABS8PE05_9PSEU|nr:glycerate kinase [Actinomycetospora endophytica]MCD2196515.1 glycerate kinase [Actinomycetospora endophytica]